MAGIKSFRLSFLCKLCTETHSFKLTIVTHLSMATKTLPQKSCRFLSLQGWIQRLFKLSLNQLIFFQGSIWCIPSSFYTRLGQHLPSHCLYLHPRFTRAHLHHLEDLHFFVYIVLIHFHSSHAAWQSQVCSQDKIFLTVPRSLIHHLLQTFLTGL